MLTGCGQDLRYAVRSLRRTPAFTIAAVLTLVIGIGANTAMFSLVDAVLLRSLPVPVARQLFVVRETDPAGAGSPAEQRRMLRFSYPRFTDLAAALPADARLAAMTRVIRLSVRTSSTAPASIVSGQLVSGQFFDTFGVRAIAGRLLSEADTRIVDGHPVAVVSERYWRRQFGGAPDVVGRRVSVNGQPFTIVGVAAGPFDGPFADDRTSMWVPLAMQHALRYRGSASTHGDADAEQPWMPQDKVAWLQIVARIPGSVDRARDALAQANRIGLARYAADENEQQRRRLLAHGVALDRVAGGLTTARDHDQLARALLILSGIVAIVLLVAAVNIANLLLARASARQREIAVRLWLGATRTRLIRQCLTESLLIATAGGAGGLFVGEYAGHIAASWFSNTTSDLVQPLSPDASVLAFTAAASIGTAMLFGILPALRTTGDRALAGAGRSTATQSAVKGMAPLVGAQLAMSVMVVVAAALLGRTLINLSRLDPGFEREHLIAISFDPLLSGYANGDTAAMYERVIAAVQRVPGVSSAAVSMIGILSGDQSISNYQFEGYQPAADEPNEVQVNLVGPDYFRTTGIRVVRGREFRAGDTSRPLAIVNEALARRYFRSGTPVGKRLGEATLDTEIVGVVRDAAVRGVRESAMPTVYFPVEGTAFARSLDIRVTRDPAPLVPAIREAIQHTEPGLVLIRMDPIADALDGSIAGERRIAYATTTFAGIALLLACIGLYGVLSYAVVRRTQEIGVRVAVGAAPRDVLRLILVDAWRITSAGLAAGLVGAFAFRTLLARLLFGVDGADPSTYVVVGGALLIVMLAAALIPARRAARVDPIIALRTE